MGTGALPYDRLFTPTSLGLQVRDDRTYLRAAAVEMIDDLRTNVHSSAAPEVLISMSNARKGNDYLLLIVRCITDGGKAGH